MRTALALFALLAGCKGSSDKPVETPWTAMFRPLMLEEMCREGSFFRECFDVSADACGEVARRHIDGCIVENELVVRKAVDQESGRLAGQMVGSCAGNRYQVEHTSRGRFRNTAKCNDPTAWVPR